MCHHWDTFNGIWRTIPYESHIHMPPIHDDVIKWKHFPRYWPFVRGIHRCPVNSPHKGQWRGALMFSLNCTLINGRVNNREAGDMRCHHAHYDVIVMRNVELPPSNLCLVSLIGCLLWVLFKKKTAMSCSKTCLATVLIRSIFAREKLHERFSASAVFQRKIERINTVARHVLL